jgi:transposase
MPAALVDDELWELIEPLLPRPRHPAGVPVRAAGLADVGRSAYNVGAVANGCPEKDWSVWTAFEPRVPASSVEVMRTLFELEVKANSIRDLAIVLTAAEKRDKALAALAEARALYDEKGHTVGVARVGQLHAEVAATL